MCSPTLTIHLACAACPKQVRTVQIRQPVTPLLYPRTRNNEPIIKLSIANLQPKEEHVTQNKGSHTRKQRG